MNPQFGMVPPLAGYGLPPGPPSGNTMGPPQPNMRPAVNGVDNYLSGGMKPFQGPPGAMLNGPTVSQNGPLTRSPGPQGYGDVSKPPGVGAPQPSMGLQRTPVNHMVPPTSTSDHLSHQIGSLSIGPPQPGMRSQTPGQDISSVYSPPHSGTPAIASTQGGFYSSQSAAVQSHPPSHLSGPPSHLSGPPSHHIGPPSHPGRPPSHPSGPPSHPGGPPPHSSGSVSHQSGPPSHPGGAPSHTAGPLPHPSVPNSHHSGPPSHLAGPPPHSGLPPNSGPDLQVTGTLPQAGYSMPLRPSAGSTQPGQFPPQVPMGMQNRFAPPHGVSPRSWVRSPLSAEDLFAGIFN